MICLKTASKDSLKLLNNNLERFPPIQNPVSMDEYDSVYNIRFYSGVVTFHVDKNKCMEPEILRNCENVDGSIASDFRYEGLESVLVNWPSIFSKNIIKNVRGGEGTSKKFLKKLGFMLSTNTKLKIKQFFQR